MDLPTRAGEGRGKEEGRKGERETGRVGVVDTWLTDVDFGLFGGRGYFAPLVVGRLL